MKGIRRSLTVEGMNLERLIRQAGDKGISLTRLRRGGRRMTALAAEDQLPALQEMAQKGGWSLTCGRRHGVGRLLDMLHGRRVLAVCATIALLALVIAGAVNWGLIGFFRFDLIAFIFGNMSWISRIIYALVGISGLYMVSAFGRIRSKEET